MQTGDAEARDPGGGEAIRSGSDREGGGEPLDQRRQMIFDHWIGYVT
jgi:hypothetical protein